MNEKTDLQKGWEFSAHLFGTDIAVQAGNRMLCK